MIFEWWTACLKSTKLVGSSAWILRGSCSGSDIELVNIDISYTTRILITERSTTIYKDLNFRCGYRARLLMFIG